MTVEVNDDAKKIIKTYSLIYTIIFILGLPILAFLTSIGIFVNLYTKAQNVDVSIDDSIKIDSIINKKKKEFEQYKSTISGLSGNNLVLKVFDGPFNMNKNFLVSKNNILIYKGLVLPSFISHKLPLPIQDKKFFSKIGYNLNELSSYLNKVVLTKFDTKKLGKYNRPTLLTIPNNDLVSFFSLKCLNSNKVISKVCDEYSKYFIDVMSIYDLSSDIEGIKIIGDSFLGNNDFKDSFCKGLYKYFQNSHNTNNGFANIVASCGGEVDNLYTALKDLNIIKKDLKDVTSSYVSDDKELNAYKLLSLQQLIYNEVDKRRLNQPRISAYLQFIKELLKKEKTLEHVYFDEAFLFNNTYLDSILKLPAFNMSLGEKEITKILRQTIKSINVGSKLEGYKGLYSRIYNKELENILNIDDITGSIEKAENITLRDRFNEKFTFDDLEIKDVKQKDDKLFVKGIIKLKIGDKKKKERFPINLVFSDYRGGFAVDYVSIIDQKNLTDVLNSIIKKNKVTMPKLYDYMLKNGDLFLNKEGEITLCDVLSGGIEGVQNCSDSQVEVKVKSGSLDLIYTFLHKKGILKDILITDKSLQKEIKSHFSGYETNSTNFLDFIKDVIKFKPKKQKKEIKNDVSQTERTIIDSDFNNYLGIKVDGILKKEGDILVAFELNNISFIGFYNIKKHILSKIFFKNIGVNSIFTNFAMELNESNSDDIELFVEDTLGYLMKINPRLVNLYKNKK